MTRDAYLKDFFKTYGLVTVLSKKNGCQVLRVRHKSLQKDLVVHSLPGHQEIYDYLCGIRHENLPEIYDTIFLEDGQIVLEEYVPGITVAEALESRLYEYADAKKILRSLLFALGHLHARGFVHRDVKPENILLGNNGRVVLIDFNTTRKLTIASRDTVVMGTVGYASPEQMGLSQSDGRTDLYAVGVLLNVMLTGRHPSEILARGKAGRIVKKCTTINPRGRFQTAEKLSRAL